MNINNLPDIYKEALCCHQLFRRMDFSSDQIWVIIAEDKRKPVPYLCVQLRAKEGDFNVAIAPCDLPEAEFKAKWAEVVEMFNAAPEEEALCMIESCKSYHQSPAILMGLMDRGITIPALLPKDKKLLN